MPPRRTSGAILLRVLFRSYFTNSKKPLVSITDPIAFKSFSLSALHTFLTCWRFGLTTLVRIHRYAVEQSFLVHEEEEIDV